MRYFEDFAVGDVYELGSRSLSQDHVIAFAREYDPQSFHVDPEAAKQSSFGTLITERLADRCRRSCRLLVNGLLKDTASMGSPGVDGIQWLKPVKPGDRLSARIRVLESMPSKSRPDRGIVKTQGEMVNQDGDLVMTIRAVNFFGRRPTASS